RRDDERPGRLEADRPEGGVALSEDALEDVVEGELRTSWNGHDVGGDRLPARRVVEDRREVYRRAGRVEDPDVALKKRAVGPRDESRRRNDHVGERKARRRERQHAG